jgi:AmmeMemoRadiSam system protein A
MGSSAQTDNSGEWSAEERQQLIQLAHSAIAAALDGCDSGVPSPSPHLDEVRGAFTTLYLDGHLRGCIGYPIGMHPLWKTVEETAVAAAFQDPRFYPVTRDEAPHLKVDISVLSPLFPIAPDEVVPGRHGLLVIQDNRRGLLLPQVATEHSWDRETFLAQTCLKAGLPPDAWKHGASLHAFTAEVFGE